jgi:predicted O-methyltransferase YrrM
VTAGGSSLPEVQKLLAVLAVGKRCAEAGTAYGEGAAAMAGTARSVVTVESDEARAAAAAERLAGLENVELVVGDWLEELPARAPFELLFLDAGGFGDRPDEVGLLALELLGPGGMLVKDDLTPDRVEPDPAREFLLEHPRLVAAELMTSPRMAVIVAVCR